METEVISVFRRGIIALFLFSSSLALNGQLLTTGLANANSGGSNFMFDLEALSSLTIDSIDIQLPSFLGQTIPLEVWTTSDGGSFVGRTLDPLSWKLVGSYEALLPQGTGSWTNVILQTPTFVREGTNRGFCIVRTDLVGFHGFTAVATGISVVANSDLIVRSGVHSVASYFSAGSPGIPSMNVHYSRNGPFGRDLRTHRFVSPVSDRFTCSVGASAEQLSVEFLNLGSLSIPAGEIVPVSVSLDGGPPINEFLAIATALPPNGSIVYSFATSIDLSALGPHSISVGHQLVMDQFSSNDQLTAEIASGGESRISSFPWSENFDGISSANIVIPPVGWVQESADAAGRNSDWFFVNSGDTHFQNTVIDHTNGQGSWALLHDHNSHHAAVSIQSPCLDLSLLTHPRLDFWVNSFNATVLADNTLSLDVIDMQSGIITMNVVGPIGSFFGAGWNLIDVDLSAFSGSVIRLVFRGSTDHGGGFSGDDHPIQIDDVSVRNVLPTPGQNAQPGFAAFKIGVTRNVNLELVDSFLGGPFFSTVNANGDMIMEFEGEPMMPILLLGGPLNPASATFPIIGALDLGNVVDPLTGIPTGIQVLADGNLTVGLDSFFNTGPLGMNQIGIHIGNLPPGILANLQCAMRTSGANGSYIALSNAIQVTVQ